MNVALVLWSYALVLGTAGVMIMRRATWVNRSPRLAIVAWQASTMSVLLAVVFGGVALAVPTDMVSMNLARLVESCATMLQAQYAGPGNAGSAVVGSIIAAAVAGRWSYCTLRELWRSAAVRRHHHELLALVGRSEQDLGVTVLDDERPYVYCVAGRRHRIVLTTGANDVLDPDQLSAVLAHERAHLHGRHHLVIGAAAAMARAFPVVPLCTMARDEVARLVELAADDAATRSAHRLTLAEAMLTLSAAAPPAGALAASGSTAAARVRRLITGRRPVARWVAALGVTAALTLLAAPLVTITTPAVTAGPDCCTVDVPRVVAADECSTAYRGAC